VLLHGVPEHVRSDPGAEMTAGRVKVGAPGTQPETGSPWKNAYCESFNGKLWDECLNGQIFYSLREAQVIVGVWRKYYNTVRQHSALSNRAPAPPRCLAAASKRQPWLSLPSPAAVSIRSAKEDFEVRYFRILAHRAILSIELVKTIGQVTFINASVY
jgi:integrase-like protein